MGEVECAEGAREFVGGRVGCFALRSRKPAGDTCRGCGFKQVDSLADLRKKARPEQVDCRSNLSRRRTNRSCFAIRLCSWLHREVFDQLQPSTLAI